MSGSTLFRISVLISNEVARPMQGSHWIAIESYKAFPRNVYPSPSIDLLVPETVAKILLSALFGYVEKSVGLCEQSKAYKPRSVICCKKIDEPRDRRNDPP
jgi:hypothetical protein